MECVNARLKVFWGADDGNVTGSRRFFALLSVVMVVHASFATLLAMTPRREGTLGKMRLSPIADALYGKVRPKLPRKKKLKSKDRQLKLKLAS